eukprot:9280172-Pyramimonas_sp.AAC.2
MDRVNPWFLHCVHLVDTVCQLCVSRLYLVVSVMGNTTRGVDPVGILDYSRVSGREIQIGFDDLIGIGSL